MEALGRAAAIVSGGSTYREMPEQWVLHQLRRAGFRVVGTKQFAMRLTGQTLKKQTDFAR